MNRTIILLTLVLFSEYLQATPLPNKPHIYVEGSAEIEVEPDVATFSVLLENINQNAETAKKDVDDKSVSLLKLCQKFEIAVEDIAATGIRVRKEYEYQEQSDIDVYVGVNVSRSVTIDLRDLSKYKNVMHEISSSGISENISTHFSISNQQEYTDKALLLAMKDAEQRAKAIAKIQGVKLGKIHSTNEFNLRQSEHFRLRVSRKVEGQSNPLTSAIVAEDIGRLPNSTLVESLQRIRGTVDPFDVSSMKARAQIFVVFLIK